MKNCTTITGGLKEALVAVSDNTALEKDRDELQDECEVVMELMRKWFRQTLAQRRIK